MQHFKRLAVSYNVHNIIYDKVIDDTPAVDALGSPLDELLDTPFSIVEFFAEYVDVTAITAEVDDNITIST